MKYDKYRTKMVVLFSLIAITLVSGCVGTGLRNIMTEEKPYEELVKEIPNIQEGYGRVFIYSPKGGPSYPLNSMGDIDFFSIDKTIYRFGGESYFYLDIETGAHLLTVTNVLVRGFASNKKQYGKNSLEININNGQVIYLRFINQSKSKSIDDRAYSVSIIERNIAEKELVNLTLWNNHKTTMKIE